MGRAHLRLLWVRAFKTIEELRAELVEFARRYNETWIVARHVRAFKTIEELRAELVEFARRYNETWIVARHGYKTPARVREEQTMPRIAIDPTLAASLPWAA